MNQSRSQLASAVAVCAAFAAGSPGFVHAAFQDGLVQPETLTPPGRASIVGSLAGQQFGPESLAQGTIALPLPLAFPQARGPLLWSIAPSYEPGAGTSIWGHGWRNALTISRARYTGYLDGVTDDFVSPWGRLTRGDDGHDYPVGFSASIRFTRDDDDRWIATGGDGTVYTFEPLRVDGVAATFEWHLVEVRAVTGQLTRFAYDRGENRRYLRMVTYGGHHADSLAYEVELTPEPLDAPIVDYAFGYRRALDRRVATVHVRARVGADASGALRELWSYDLQYQAGAFGPAFYLQRLTRSLPGESRSVREPSVTYEYNDGAAHLASVEGVSYEPLSEFFSTRGGTWIQPRSTASFDPDHDGVVAFENTETYETLFFDGVRWQTGTVPEARDAHLGCRPRPGPRVPARHLTQIFGPEAETYALWTRFSVSGSTEVVLCHRDGALAAERELAGRWDLTPTTRLVDIDRDHRPDLIRLESGRVRYRFNESHGDTLAFGDEVVQMLSPSLPIRTAWIHDVNGDGWADLVGKMPTRLFVWPGLATGGFDPEGIALDFVRDGRSMPVGRGELSFVDANGDGLADVVATSTATASLYMNTGARFEFAHRLDDRLGGELSGIPLARNLTDSGEQELLFSSARAVRVMELTEPSTGLLTSVDDGRGNAIDLLYARSEPASGLPQRPRVLDAVVHRSTGLDDIAYDYDFSAPVVHPEGRFLVGFGAVVREGPDGTREQQYFHDAELRNIPIYSRHAWHAETDAAGAMAVFESVTEQHYEEATHRGVRLRRPSEVRAGIRAGGGALGNARTTRFATYERGLCPTVTTVESRHGTLTRTRALATAAGLDDSLHCLTGTETLAGSHPHDAALDFSERRRIERNALGQPTAFVRAAGREPWTVQTIGYDAQHRVHTVTVPGRGTTALRYDATGRLEAVVHPDGVVTEVDAYSAADLIEELVTLRGEDSAYRQSFRYDDFLRLSKSWDDFRGGTESQPLEQLTYALPTHDTLGATYVSSLVDLAGARSGSVGWLAADGTTLATATWIPARTGEPAWVVGGLIEPSRNTLSTTRYLAPRYTGAWNDTTAADLRSGAIDVGSSVATASGAPRQSASLLQGPRDLAGRDLPALRSELDHWYAVSPDGLVATSRVAANGGATASSVSDHGDVLRIVNEAGDTTRFAYDAAGRLRRVTLDDGTTHAVHFDGFGRPTELARSDVGRIRFAYEPQTGRIAERRFHPPATGGPIRLIAYAYDAIGRVARETHRAPASGGEITYEYGYDGAGTDAPGQQGRLTRVSGPDYARETLYNPDGSVQQVTATLGNWRRATTTFAYNAAAAVTDEQFEITHPATGAPILSAHIEREYDAHGRLWKLYRNRALLAELAYDDFGRIDHAALDGKTLVFLYDDHTRAPAGYWIDAGTWNAGIDWLFDARGHVDVELLTLDGSQSLRDYDYDARGYLSESRDEDGQLSRYRYDSTGLISSLDDAQGARAVGRGPHRTVGDTAYHYDALGRLTQKADLTLTYGPHGQLATATRPGAAWAFTYDEAGNRVLKRKAGAPVAGYLDDLYLDDTHVVEPLRIGSVLLGLVVNGELELLATDPRGTLWVQPNGQRNLPSPYGLRAAHPDLAPALDYAQKGYDADLGFIRMGVRDYDPYLGHFTTPDPLFLEDLSQCARSPVECNLYGYARNNPVTFTDPSGTFGWVGALIGATIELGIEGYSQYQRGEFDLRRLAGAGAVGAVTGLTGGYLAGARHLTRAQRIIGSGLTVAMGQTALRTYNDEPTTPQDLAIDVAVGSGGAALGEYSHVLTRQIRAARAGRSRRLTLDEIDAVAANPEVQAAAESLGPPAGGGARPPNRIYSTRELARRAAEPGPFHNFPESLNNDIFAGTRTVVSDDYVLYTKRGSITLPGREVTNAAGEVVRTPARVVEGTFEIGVRPSPSGRTEVIRHRFFRPD